MMNESKSKKRIFFGIFFIGMLLVVCSIAITVLVIDSSRDDHVVDIAIDKVTYGDYIVLSIRYCPNINDDIEYLILLYDPYGKIRFDLSDYEDGPIECLSIEGSTGVKADVLGIWNIYYKFVAKPSGDVLRDGWYQFEVVQEYITPTPTATTTVTYYPTQTTQSIPTPTETYPTFPTIPTLPELPKIPMEYVYLTALICVTVIAFAYIRYR